MKFHVDFTYRVQDREKLLSFLHSGGLSAEGPAKVLGAWLPVQSGKGYAMIETDDSTAIYLMCSEWAEYGEVKVTPVIDATRI